LDFDSFQLVRRNRAPRNGNNGFLRTHFDEEHFAILADGQIPALLTKADFHLGPLFGNNPIVTENVIALSSLFLLVLIFADKNISFHHRDEGEIFLGLLGLKAREFFLPEDRNRQETHKA
jgi:hypothetical protein